MGGAPSGTEKKNTGYQNNYAFGGYLTRDFGVKAFYGGELFYNRTTSRDLSRVSLSHLNVIPTIGSKMYDTNFYLELGIGAGILLENEGLEENYGGDINTVEIAGKLSCGYHLNAIGRIEVGAYAGSATISDIMTRAMFVVSTKFQLDSLF